MSKFSRIMEFIWVLLSAICFAIGAYSTIKVGFQDGFMFFVLATLALAMYWLRRYRRIKEAERNNSEL